MVDNHAILAVILCLLQIITQPTCTSCNISNYINGIIGRETEGGDVVVFLETVRDEKEDRNRVRREAVAQSSKLVIHEDNNCTSPDFSDMIRRSMIEMNNTFIFLNAKQSNLSEEVGKIMSRKARMMIIWVHFYNDKWFGKMLLGSSTRRVVSPLTKTIVILEDPNDNKRNIIKQVFKHIFDQIARLELFIFVKSGCNFVLVKMYRYGKENFQSNLDHINWDKNGRFVDAIPRNFKGQGLKIGFPHSPPYVFKGVKKQPPQGVEIEIIRTIAQYFNMTPKYVQAPSIYLKFTGKTLCIMFMLINRGGNFGADIGCGDLTFQFEQFDFISPLMPFSFRQSIFCAIRPLQIDKTRSLYGMMSTNVWALVLVTVIAFTIAMFIATSVNRGKKSFIEHLIEVVGTHVDVSLSETMLAHSSKMTAGIMMLYAVVISTLYKANLKVSVTVPYVIPPIRSCLEAVKSNLSFYLMVDDRSSLNLNSFYPIAEKSNMLNYFSDVDSDITGVKTAGAGVLFKDQDFLRYLLLTNDYSPYIVNFVFDNAVTRPVSIVMAPGHPLHPLFDKIQSYIIEGGFPGYWHSLTFHKLSLTHKNARHGDDRKPMTLDNLSPIFYLLLLMVVVDTVIFIFEHLIHHVKRFLRKRKAQKKLNVKYDCSTCKYEDCRCNGNDLGNSRKSYAGTSY